MPENHAVKFPISKELEMKAVRCPSCGAAMKGNGRTGAGSQRWRCRACGASPTARLANSSLEAACSTLSLGERPVVHSDRGGHCRWPGWIGICRENRLVRSMSRKGRSCDNARMEGFFGTLKREFFRGRG